MASCNKQHGVTTGAETGINVRADLRLESMERT
jgi:hypothetical protein